jgi:GT2 family glycosyltransferase
MTKIDVVIVNWNTGSFLYECILSLLNYGKDLIQDIIVVDNHSSDDSLDKIQNIDGVILIENDKNYGFAKGCNIGANYSKSDFILFLNPDARIYVNTLAICLNFYQKKENNNIGILGVKLEDEEGKINSRCSRFPSVSNIFSHALGLDRFFPSLSSFMLEFDHESTRFVDQIIGAFFMVRKETYNQIGGFDERFFLYMDEVDFSFRAKQLGYKSIYLSEAKAFHHGEVSSSNVKDRRLFYSLRSRIQYSNKHFSKINLIFVIVLTLIIEPLARIIDCIMHLNVTNLKNTMMAYKLLYIWILKKII